MTYGHRHDVQANKNERGPRARPDLRRPPGQPLPLPGVPAAVLRPARAHGRGLRRTRPGAHRLQRDLRRHPGPDGVSGGPLRPAAHADPGAMPVGRRLRLGRRVPGVSVAALRLGARRHRQLGLPPVRLLDPGFGDRSGAGRTRLLHPHLLRILRRRDRTHRDGARGQRRGPARRADLRRTARPRGRGGAAGGARDGPGGAALRRRSGARPNPARRAPCCRRR